MAEYNVLLQIFARMLLTKKKFLDINRRAVSKRIKGIRKAGGERLKEFNQKKARHAQLGNNHSEAAAAMSSAATNMLPPSQVKTAASDPKAAGGGTVAQVPAGGVPPGLPRPVF